MCCFIFDLQRERKLVNFVVLVEVARRKEEGGHEAQML
jgi:hypothetical protein